MGGNQRELSLILRLKDQASRELQTFQTKAEQLRPTFNRMAVVGTAAFGAISFGIGKAVQEASRVQEIDRLFDATFNETRSSMAQWSSDIAKQFGRAEHDIREMAALAGGVFATAFDVAESEVADLTMGMGEAAIAVAALDPRISSGQQAMEGFTQALVGNRQRVIDWGFQVRDAQLEARALEDGIIGVGEKLDQQQKAMLTAKMITEQVSISTRVLNESQEDWSQISQRLQGQIKEVTATLGQQFLPIIEDVASKIVPVITAVGDWIEQHPILTRNLIIAAAAAAGIVAVLGALGLIILSVSASLVAFNPVVLGVAGFLLMLAGTVDRVVRIIQILRDDWTLVWSGMKIIAGEAVDWIIDKVSELTKSLGAVIKLINKVASFTGPGGLANIGMSLGKGLGRMIGVNDAIISPNGNIITTNPKDYLIATQNPRELAGGGGPTHIHIMLDGREVSEVVYDNLMGTLMANRKLAS